ncbi:MAG: glycosyltransferase family 1 protein, partial [Candidatus Electrothrix sp. ATG2]|nr:glycosyltransferase family 1 protein [Candidatus Electrothrix sp. ATG2]
KKATDMDVRHFEGQIQAKSVILYPGIDFQYIDAYADDSSAEGRGDKSEKDNGPVIIWNHRWEHDKDPETFFQTLFELVTEYSFRLIILGQHFRYQPEIFAQAKKILADRLLHFGYAESREEYARLLKMGDYIVSTARHEFFGISVLEGVRAGCRPVVPDRLSYRELFPQEYRYSEGQLRDCLQNLLAAPCSLTRDEVRTLTEPYSWPTIRGRYRNWLRFKRMASD